jgi:hypothetical protein
MLDVTEECGMTEKTLLFSGLFFDAVNGRLLQLRILNQGRIF